MKQKHPFYTLTLNRLNQRFTRLSGAHRLGNITKQELQIQRDKEFTAAQQQIYAYESRRRIPDWLKGITFYGATDEWQFIQSDSPHMCDECKSYSSNIYFGSSLRSEFPDHLIQDENTLASLVHPNCLCTLVRVFPIEA